MKVHLKRTALNSLALCGLRPENWVLLELMQQQRDGILCENCLMAVSGKTNSTQPDHGITTAGSGADCAICWHLQGELERLERDHAEKLGAVSGEWLSSDARHRALAAESESRQELETLQGQIHDHKLRHRKR